MGEKKNIVLIIIVVILLLICIGMGTFIFINKDKLISKETLEVEKSEQKENKEEKNDTAVLELDDKKVETLYNMTKSEYNECGYATQPLLLENVGNKLTHTTMNDNYKGIIIYDYVTKEKNISEEHMKEAYEKVFGPNTYQIMNKIYFDALGTIEYDTNNKKYNLSFEPNGIWPCVTHLYNKEKVIKAIEKTDSIQITTAYIFNGNFSSELYKDAKEKEPIGITMSINEDEAKTLKYIDEHQDELHQLTYTFKKLSDGNYYYSEVERTK